MNKRLLFLIILTCIISQAEESNSRINYYADLISNAYKNGLTYQLPTDASEYDSNERSESKLICISQCI
jgi:hypothetical protein